MGSEVARQPRSRYAEFSITLTAERDQKDPGQTRYRTTALLPDGTAAAEGYFVNPLAPWMVEAALSSVAAAGKSMQRSVATDSLDPVKDLGARLYDALFSSSIERAFYRTVEVEREAHVRLVLSDEEAMSIPWEFLYDRRRNDFLVLSTRTPLVRSVRRDLPVEPPRALQSPVRVLAAASDVTNSWNVENEWKILEDFATSADVSLQKLQGVSWPQFFQAVMEFDPDVVHLLATGLGDQTQLVGQALAFLSEATTAIGQRGYLQVSADDLIRAMSSAPRPHLVVLNGCRTDGIASALARVVPAVIGHRGDITDDAALSFTEGLYRALSRGLPLDSAVTKARLQVDSRAPGGREWSAPVLYQQDASAVLFPSPERSMSAHAPEALLGKVAPRQQVTESSDDRSLQKLNSLLAIHQANLDAQLERTQQLGAASPSYLQGEIETTEREIRRLSEQIEASKRGNHD
jgi:hypothetical protein